MAFAGKLCPKVIPFPGFGYMKRWGTLSFRLVKRPKRAVKKVYITFWFVIYSYFKDRAITAVKRDAKF